MTHVACRMLHVALLHVARGMLHVARCTLHAVSYTQDHHARPSQWIVTCLRAGDKKAAYTACDMAVETAGCTCGLGTSSKYSHKQLLLRLCVCGGVAVGGRDGRTVCCSHVASPTCCGPQVHGEEWRFDATGGHPTGRVRGTDVGTR
jgi:hypothetical protein